MKILLWSDLHAHPWLQFGLDDNRFPRRLGEQWSVLRQILSLTESHGVEAQIFGGDLVHKHDDIPKAALYTLRQYFDNLTIPFASVDDGNHDLSNKKEPRAHDRTSQIIFPYIQHYVTEEWFAKRGVKVRLVGYATPVDYDALVGYDLVVLHKTPSGAKSRDFVFDDGVDWRRLAANNKTVWFGHIHQSQILADNCIVMGAPMEMEHGEVGERGVWLYDTDRNAIEFLPLQYPRFVTTEDPSSVKDDGNYYRVLNVTQKIESDNPRVVSVVVPEVFTERMTSTALLDTVEEWRTIQEAPKEYLDPILELVNEHSGRISKVYDGVISMVDIENFCSIGAAKVIFEPGFTSITADTSTGFVSNGSGKTSLFEAVMWCLHGETTKGLKADDVIKDRPEKEKDCRVTVTLTRDKDGSSLTITRTRREGLFVTECYSDGSCRAVIDGGRKTDDQKQLEHAILGFTKEMFLSACYFSQENLVSFTGLSDTAKTDMVTTLLGFGVYDDLYSAVHTDKCAAETGRTKLESALREERIREGYVQETVTKTETGIFQTKKDISDTIRDKELTEAELTERRGDLAALKKPQRNQDVSADLDIQINELTERIRVVKAQVSDTDRDPAVVSARTLVSKLERSIGSTQSEIRSTEQEITRLTSDLSKLQSQTVGQACSYCGEVISKVDVLNANIKRCADALATARHELTLRQENLTQDNERLDEAQAVITEHDIKIRQLTTTQDKLSEELQELTSRRLAAVEESFKETAAYEQTKSQIDQQISRLTIRIEFLTKHLSGLQTALDDANNLLDDQQDKLIEHRQHIAEIEQQMVAADLRIQILDFWKNAFSPKGIRALLLDRFCNEFNQIVNKYLAIASSGRMSVVIRPTKTLKSKEERNKIGVDVYFDGQSVQFARLSGGEKRRIEVANCLALNTWVGLRNGSISGMLGLVVFDEVFSFIDRSGEEAIASMFRQEHSDRSINVISHTSELSDYADHFIVARKENDTTTFHC